MAYQQRPCRSSLLSLGATATTASTSILLGRYFSLKSNQQMTEVVATPTLTTMTRQLFKSFPKATYERQFTTTVPKETGGGKGFMQWYEGHLSTRPVTTKAITGSILWGLGDIVGQTVPTYFQENSQDTLDESTRLDSKKGFEYDFPRTAKAVFYGFALHAPMSHLHFNFLEWLTIRGGFQGFSVPIFKTIMEQFVYWSWISNSLYHGAMGAMQGMTLSQIYNRISDVLWDTQVAQWSFWIPVQLLNFQFVPVRHQLNVVLLTSVAWTALLSAWYPPKKNTDESMKQEK